MLTHVYPADPVSYYNPLHVAVLRNRPSIVRLLVEHGASVEKRDRVRHLSNLDACLLFILVVPTRFSFAFHLMNYTFVLVDP